MREAMGTLSPMAEELAPILATIDGPERAGHVMPQDVAAMIQVMRHRAEEILGEESDASEIAAAFDNLLGALHRYGLAETARNGTLMVDGAGDRTEERIAEETAPTQHTE